MTWAAATGPTFWTRIWGSVPAAIRSRPVTWSSGWRSRCATARASARAGGWKALASAIRPEMSDDPERSRRWLSDALNPDRREVLHAEHLITALRVGRRVECHVLKHWLDQETGYQKSEPAGSRPRRVILAERLQELTAELRRVSEELEVPTDTAELSVVER